MSLEAFRGRTALVTGASSGLGAGLARWLARRGVRVWAAARRADRLAALRAECGDLVEPLELDVADARGAFARIQALDAACGGLDLVIANAGVGEQTRLRELDHEAAQRMIEVNVAGATATLLAAAPGMVARRRGHLVGMSSLAALAPFPGASTYGASKAYLRAFCDALRLDVARHGVAVTSLHPGFVRSEMTSSRPAEAMPFLLETDDAVERMGRALLRRSRTHAFPLRAALLVRAVGALPHPVRERLAGRGRGARKRPAKERS